MPSFPLPLSPHLLACVGLALGALPACAAELWEATTERGLTVYSIEAQGGLLRISCDPDRVFGETPNSALSVRMPHDPDPQRIVLLAESGEQIRLPAKDNQVRQFETDPDAWHKLMRLIRMGGAFAVVTSRDSLLLETAPLPDLTCD